MKKIYTAFFILMCMQYANASNEVPNPSFENWASGIPVSWGALNIPATPPTTTQVTPGNSGTYAAKGQPVYRSANNDTISPNLFASGNFGATGFPVTMNYNTLEFYYKSSLIGGDVFNIFVQVYDQYSLPIGSGYIDIPANSASFTRGTVAINYFTAGTAAFANIAFTLYGSVYSPSPSSWYIVDDVSLLNLTGFKSPAILDNIQIYPTPAHNKVFVKGLEFHQPYSIRLTDITGRMVLEKKCNPSAGSPAEDELSLVGINRGYYFLCVCAEEKTMTRKIIVE